MAFAVVLTIGAVANAQTPGASSGSGYRVSPVREEKTIERGTSTKTTIFVENTTSAAIETKAVINNFVADGETGQPKVDLENKLVISNDFRSLVSPIPNFTIQPKQKIAIPVTLNVSSSSSPGGYYGAIRFTPVSEEAGDAKVSLTASVGTIFLIKVPGQLNETLSLQEFSVANNGNKGTFFVNASDGLKSIIRIKNSGNIHSKPFGKVQVLKGDKVVEEFELTNPGQETGNILPGQTRAYENKLKNTKWLGKYKITANLSYGDGGNVITSTKTFWVVPVWVPIVFIALVAFLVFGAIYLLSKRRRSGSTKSKFSRR